MEEQQCQGMQLQAEYTIHVQDGSRDSLRFALLASTWLPRFLGVILWIALHILLLIASNVMFLIYLVLFFLLGSSLDVSIAVFNRLPCLVLLILLLVFMVLGTVIGWALAWIWFAVSCQCRRLPVRPPDQGVAHYILFVGGTQQWWINNLDEIRQGPFVDGVFKHKENMLLQVIVMRHFMTVDFCKDVVADWLHFWRGSGQNYCREIRLCDDTLVI